MSDDSKLEKINRITLDEPQGLDDTDKVILKANEALVVHEFRRMLERQAERDVIIDEMRGIIDTLAVGHVMAVEQIKKLQNAHGVLLRQQVELGERQDIISAVCDAFTARLEAVTLELGDRD